MRGTFTSGLRACLGFAAVAMSGHAIGADASAPEQPVVTAAASSFTAPQRDRVRSWIRDLVPECPRAVAERAVDGFLEDLQRQAPASFGQLLIPEFAAERFRSLLLRHVGADMTDAVDAGVRGEVAHKRIQAVLAAGGRSSMDDNRDAAADLAEKIRGMPSIHWRRLLEGRMEDDELMVLIKKAQAGEPSATNSSAAKLTAPPKVLSAAEIVSEYGRRNQEGSSLQRFRAITVQGRLETPTGQQVDILFSKMRPDRFRMAVSTDGMTRVVTAFDGKQFWRHVRGQRPQTITVEEVGTLVYLREFADPLFAEEGIGFERLEDATTEEGKLFRIAVKRRDGSRYVARIDQETFYQVGREVDDKTTIRYSDFRRIFGLNIAFCEESMDQQKGKTVLTITRVTPNPGLIQAFFDKREPIAPGLFGLEWMLRPVSTASK